MWVIHHNVSPMDGEACASSVGIGMALVGKPTHNQHCIDGHLLVSFVPVSLFIGHSSLVFSSVLLVGSQPPATALPWVKFQFNVCALAQQLWLEPQRTGSCGVLACLFVSLWGVPFVSFQRWF